MSHAAFLAATTLTCALAACAGALAACAADASAPSHAKRVGRPPVHVTQMVAEGTTVWVATRGAGVIGVSGANRTPLDLGDGLPSAVVDDVQPLGKALLVATPHGLFAADPERKSYRCIGADSAAAVDGSEAAEIVRRVPGAPEVLVQLRGFDGTQRTGRVDTRELRLTGGTGWPAGTAMAMRVDEPSQCLDVAGMNRAGLVPTLWVATQCPGAPTVRTVHTKFDQDVVGVAAVARDPASRQRVLALIRQHGNDPRSRHTELMVSDARGRLRPHCSGLSVKNDVVGMVSEPARRRLVLALHGEGLRAVGCRSVPPHALAGEPRLRFVTSLSTGSRGRIFVGTETGAFVVDAKSQDLTQLLDSPEDAMPSDATPTDVSSDGQHILVSSAREGIVEMRRASTGWAMSRRWRTPQPLPAGPYGPAFYGVGTEIYVLNHRLGLLRITGTEPHWQLDWLALSADSADPFERPVRWSQKAPDSAPRVWTHFARDGAGGVWLGLHVLGAGTPPETLLHLRSDGSSASAPVRDARLRPAGAMLTIERGKTWGATRMGLIEFRDAAPARRLSHHRVQMLFRNERSGAVAAVGGSIETLRDGRLQPVLFGIPGIAAVGHPVDVVVDNEGRWTILYASGRVVRLDAQGGFQEVLGKEGGFPTTGTRLLHVPQTDEIFLGTADSGLFLLQRQRRP